VTHAISLRPAFHDTIGFRHDRGGILRDTPAMKRRLHDPPAHEMSGIVRRQQPRTHEFAQQRRTAIADELVLARDEDLLDRLRVVDEHETLRPEPKRRDRTVATRRRGKIAQQPTRRRGA
jgi:hypothetical protein